MNSLIDIFLSTMEKGPNHKTLLFVIEGWLTVNFILLKIYLQQNLISWDELDEIHVTLLLYKLQHYFGAVVQTLRITSVNIRTNLMHAKYINTQYS